MSTLAAPPLQRSNGRISLTAKPAAAGSALSDLHQSGSGKVLMTKGAGALEGVILNTSGGLTGGDKFEVSATALSKAHVRLTTQAAERIYRSPDKSFGQVRTQLTVEDGGRLDWLPQETIVFNGGRLDRALELDLRGRASALLSEAVVFGRATMGEEVERAGLMDAVTIRHNGKMIFQDRTRLGEQVTDALDRTAVLGGARAMALVVFSGPGASGHLDVLRALVPDTGGASAPRESVVVVRLLAPDSFALRQHLLPILDYLTDQQTPRSWRL